jgi:DNA-binding transcriptional ArsR family regulator
MATKVEQRQARVNRQKAMSHPLRAAILLHLYEHGEAAPVEMADALEEKLESVSHHTKRLEEYGCIELVKTEPRRGATKHWYRRIEEHLVDTGEWDDLNPLDREGLIGDFFQPTIDDIVRSVKARMLGADERFHVTRCLQKVDAAGREKALEIHLRAFEELQANEVESIERMAQSGEAPTIISSSQGCFEVPSF